MKRIGNLWHELASFPNLHRAYRKARRGKRASPAVERFEFRVEYELAELHEELLAHSYTPGPYRTGQNETTSAFEMRRWL